MSPHTILLVEDNPVDVDLTRRALSRSPVKLPLIIARDGQEALDLIPQWESGTVSVPRLILLDIKLPKVDGLDVLKCLRRHPRFGHIPVVMLTTSSEDIDVARAYELGANSYVVKPVEYDEFLRVASQIEQYWRALNLPHPHL